MKSWTVYKHISPSGKVYVGISSNIKNRWAANGYYYHLSDTVFSKALKKYGWSNFQHEIIQENLSKQEACNLEIELIAYYKTKGISYNITDGGEGYSGKHSNEHIKHRIDSRIANSDTDYLVIDRAFNYIICKTEREASEVLGGTQRNISHVLRQPIGYTFKKHYIWKHKKGTIVDIESIKKQIQKALDVRKQKMSEHAKAISAKMVAGSIKQRESLTEEEKKERYKKLIRTGKVIQMLNGLVINTFDSAIDAKNALGISSSNILECAKGHRKTAGGFNWKFKKEMEVQYDDHRDVCSI